MTCMETLRSLTDALTICSFVFAGWQFFSWRKQQRHSLELEAVLTMEDLFEIYVESLLRQVSYFNKARMLAHQSNDQSRQDRARVNNYLKTDFKVLFEGLRTEIAQNFKSYTLARYRVIRLNFDIEKISELDPVWIREQFDNFTLERVPVNDAAEKISDIKKRAFEEFRTLRKSK